MFSKPTDLFKFVNVRPTRAIPDMIRRKKYIPYYPSSYYQELVKLSKNVDFMWLPVVVKRQRLDVTAEAILSTAAFSSGTLTPLLMAVQKATEAATVADAKQQLQLLLTQSLHDYLSDASLQSLTDQLWNNVYANALASSKPLDEVSLVYQAIRAIYFLQILDTQQDTEQPLTQAQVEEMALTLPTDLLKAICLPASRNAAAISTLSTTQPVVINKLNSLYKLITDIDNATSALKAADALYTSTATSTISSSQKVTSKTSTSTQTISTLIGLVRAPLLASPDVNKFLEASVLKLVNNMVPSAKKLDTKQLISALESKKYQLTKTFIDEVSPDEVHALRTSDAYGALINKVAIPFLRITPVVKPIMPSVTVGKTPVPATQDQVRILGIGDLLVVRENVLRYQDGEVAHIENVMGTEKREYRNDSLQQTKVTEVTSSSQTSSKIKDLQTTDKNEMSRQTQKTVSNTMSLNAGMSMSANYGAVSLSAHADMSLTHSTQQSDQSASVFAKQVTEDAKTSVITTTFAQRTTSTLDRFREKNTHLFDNTSSQQNVVGVYRWVDKYMQAQVINYGKRLMLEFVVPEPAAFYNYITATKTAAVTAGLSQPLLPSINGYPLQPSDLNKYNYQELISEYEVQDASPYPAEMLTITAAMADIINNGGNQVFAKISQDLVIPDGYVCNGVGFHADVIYQGSHLFDFSLGGINLLQHNTFSDVSGPLTMSVAGNAEAYHINIVAPCSLTEEAIAAWQMSTYKSIMTAYQTKLEAYNEAVAKATAATQVGVQIQGRNPGINQSIIQDELKKGALRLFTDNFSTIVVDGQTYTNFSFSATSDSGDIYGYPEFDVKEANVEGKIIQFFQQAFEWENLTYLFYPYFWGRMEKWPASFENFDTDPAFTDFLRAGSARVVVPVRPMYVEAIMQYMTTKEIWLGGNPPTLDDPLFVSIAEELKSADTGTAIDETQLAANTASTDPNVLPRIVDQWDYKLPTTLVHLQQDASLPDFTQTAQATSPSPAATLPEPTSTRSLHTSTVPFPATLFRGVSLKQKNETLGRSSLFNLPRRQISTMPARCAPPPTFFNKSTHAVNTIDLTLVKSAAAVIKHLRR